MKEVTSYKCDHCGLKNEDKEWMNTHERTCEYNKKLKNCTTCKRYYSEDEDYEETHAQCWEFRDEHIIGYNPPCKDWEKL